MHRAATLAASRLLGEPTTTASTSLADHVDRHGPLPTGLGADLVDMVGAAGLTGRGGAAFPTARKMWAVIAQPTAPVVVANASEGEPAAAKDKTLLARSPHLVLDGLAATARAVGADRAILYLHSGPRLGAIVREAWLERAASEATRSPAIEVITAAPGFLAGEESAVVSVINGGPALPRTKPPRVHERGVAGRPTLVANAETLAHVALIARHGADWFRTAGTVDEPGTMLLTVHVAGARPSVVETPIGTSIDEVLAAVGSSTDGVQAMLVGGYHGGWLADRDLGGINLANHAIRPRGAALGAGVLVALPADACGLVESARVLHYLASQSAGQCGPCLHGLPHLAEQFATIARPGRSGRARRRFDATAELLVGRGACRHPDGATRFAHSALGAFASEVQLHARGRCSARSRAPVLPIPTA